MLKRFLPNMYKNNIFDIDYNKLKKMNIKCILFDLDNTISPAKETLFCNKTKKLFDELKKDFIIIIFSNNYPKKLKIISSYYNVDYTSLSLKPLVYKYIYVKKKYNLKSSEIASIGDQLVTDINGGNKMGIYTILVDPMCNVDAKETFFNRKVEGLILKYFKKKNKFVKGRYYE